MARSRKRKKSVASVEDCQRIIEAYVIAAGAEEIDMREVARWAIAQEMWRPPAYDPQKACARELSRAAREEFMTDPQGREVRKRHCYVYCGR